ncbi:MAG: TonB family protein [Pseudomonadota bacterium]
MTRHETLVWTTTISVAAGLHFGLLALIAVPNQSTADLAGGTISIALAPAAIKAGENGGTETPTPETPEPSSAPTETDTVEAAPTPETVLPAEPTEPKPEPEPDPEPEPEPKPEPVVEPEPDETQPEPDPIEPIEPSTATDTDRVEAPDPGPSGQPSDADTNAGEAAIAADQAAIGPASEGDTSSDLESETATSSMAGNAAQDNYAGQVMRHLLRVRRPRASRAGSTYIRFELDENGKIIDLAVTTSSGSRRFDREAIKVVERAEPFPPPPAGVARTFTVEIEGS